MLRRFFSITVTTAAAYLLVACSAGDGAQSATARVEQGTTAQCGPGNPGGGAMTVTLLDFDRYSLQMTVLNEAGVVRLQYTSDTVNLAADLSEYPPDPIFPCTSQAQTYNGEIGIGATRAVLQTLASMADFSCDASITVSADGNITSFQPVP
jgi:hypothetical protein